MICSEHCKGEGAREEEIRLLPPVQSELEVVNLLDEDQVVVVVTDCP